MKIIVHLTEWYLIPEKSNSKISNQTYYSFLCFTFINKD